MDFQVYLDHSWEMIPDCVYIINAMLSKNSFQEMQNSDLQIWLKITNYQKNQELYSIQLKVGDFVMTRVNWSADWLILNIVMLDVTRSVVILYPSGDLKKFCCT
jgi:hypothetical protein